VATVLSNAVFAFITGGSIAAAAAFSKIAYPEMRRHGYERKFALGCISGSACLGMLIPPSVLMIVWGVITEMSIGSLFIAGIVPGMLVVVLFIAYIIWVAIRHPERVGEGTVLPESQQLARDANDKLEDKDVKVLIRSMTGVTGATKDFFLSSGLPPFVILGLMILVWFILGCIIDSISIILLTVPVFAPLAMALGFDPLAFAIIGILAIETGLLTPPFGILVFTVKAAVPDEKDLTPAEIFRGAGPFWVVLISAIVLVAIFPQIASWLPNVGNEFAR
jgi:TRAP-type C4-dicarboxylate transport system permease large subunit